MMIDIRLSTVSEFFSRQDLRDMAAAYRLECAPAFPFQPDQNAYQALEQAGRLAVIIADDAGEALGFVTLLDVSLPHFADCRLAQIESLYVRPERRGSAIAKWLMEAAENEARRRGAWSLVMTAAAGSKAERFFSRFGEKTGVILRRDLCQAI